MKLLQDKTNVDAPDATWPFGDLNDNSGSNDGTPVNKELLTDVLQLMEKLMDEAGITANGDPDNDANGWQLFEALPSLKNLATLRPALSTVVFIMRTRLIISFRHAELVSASFF